MKDHERQGYTLISVGKKDRVTEKGWRKESETRERNKLAIERDR